MKITVIGAGNAGTTIAADLKHKGHNVTLLKTSDKLHNDHFKKIIETKEIKVIDIDETYVVKLDDVTTDMEKAISEAELLIVYIQTRYHEQLIKRIAPYIRDNQVILLEPGYLSTCYLMKYVDKDITVIEATSSPIDCRVTSPGECQVLFKNVRNPFGIYPESNKEKAIKCLKELNYSEHILDNVFEAALHNPNLIVHTIGAIFSIPRIEYTNGEYWMYKEVFTPHVWNIVESLDSEKNDILEYTGCKRISYVNACKFRNSLDDSLDAMAVFRDYAENGSPKGPSVPDSRYITEDVSQGLVMLESLGKAFGIETPTCTGLINCASAALKSDFREEGRNVENLGVENVNRILNHAK